MEGEGSEPKLEADPWEISQQSSSIKLAELGLAWAFGFTFSFSTVRDITHALSVLQFFSYP